MSKKISPEMLQALTDIKHWMKIKKITQTDLAKDIGYCGPTVNQALKGNRPISKFMFNLIIVALKKRLDEDIEQQLELYQTLVGGHSWLSDQLE